MPERSNGRPWKGRKSERVSGVRISLSPQFRDNIMLMDKSKEVISEGNFMVYIWFFGGLIDSFVSGRFSDLLKSFLSSDGYSILYMSIIFIFNLVLLYFTVKYVILWVGKRYEFGNTRKLLKVTFNLFLAWSLVGIVFSYLTLSLPDKANIPLVTYSILGYAFQLIVLYVSLNRFLKIKYFS